MILDKLLMFSEKQAVTASAASTDVIDLGPDRLTALYVILVLASRWNGS